MSLIVGLTGGIASGKSTVSNMISEMGIRVIDADIEARLAVEEGEPAYHKIIEEFGTDIVAATGDLDRQKLGNLIFHNKEKRLRLNEIVHPEVRRRMNEQKESAIRKGEKIVVLDIPLLFESELTYMVDKTILVYVDLPVQLQRLCARNSLSEHEARARVDAQMPLAEKIHLADATINNNGTVEETKSQLMNIMNAWLEENIV
ncbi:MAG: dephospho-CoA kinase [Bacillota bacterium]|nr:dephospho-CoA kinase [Bacillota bacterium]